MKRRPPIPHSSRSRSPVARALTSWPARFFYLFTVLMLPWPGLGRAYAGFVSAVADAAFGGWAPATTLRFTNPDDGAAGAQAWQLKIYAEDTLTGKYVQTALDLRRGGYIAVAVFAALALVTPIRWSKRLGLLAVGLSILQIIPLLPLLSFFSGKLPVQVFHFASVLQSAIEVAYHTLVAPPGMAYAVPAMLWLLLVWLIDAKGLRRILSPLFRRGHAAGAEATATSP